MRAACLLLLVLALTVGRFDSHVRAADKLNVLLIVADDLNNNLGCYGHPLVKSPHIDRLAARGVRFDRAYCQNPVCNPSRTSFLSGRRSGSNMKGATFLPNYFHDQGYFTAEFGKVTHSYGLSATATSWDLEEKFSAARLAAVMEEHKGGPFIIAAGLGHTHPGFSHTKPFTDLYPRASIPLLSEPDNVRANVPPVAFSGVLTQQLSEDEWRKHVASYYAAISTMDAAIGQILDAVDRLQLWDSTIIVFTSDHGRHLGEHGGHQLRAAVARPATRLEESRIHNRHNRRRTGPQRAQRALSLHAMGRRIGGGTLRPRERSRRVSQPCQRPESDRDACRDAASARRRLARISAKINCRLFEWGGTP
jgi:hypothetical protein